MGNVYLYCQGFQWFDFFSNLTIFRDRMSFPFTWALYFVLFVGDFRVLAVSLLRSFFLAGFWVVHFFSDFSEYPPPSIHLYFSFLSYFAG